MTARRLFMLLHRWAGLATAAPLLVAAVTGCLLVYRPELDRALNPDLFRLPPPAERPTTPFTAPFTADDGAALAQRLAAAHPDWAIREVPLRVPPGRTARVEIAPADVTVSGRTVRGADQVFVDPRTGAVRAARSGAPGLDRAHLFAGMLALHERLLAGTPGRWLLGVSALVWLVLNPLGVAITWPRRTPRLRNWGPDWVVQRRGWRSRPLVELHRVAGLWLLLGLSVLAYTSAAFNFYYGGFVPLVEGIWPAAPDPFDRPPPPATTGPAIGFPAALAAARLAAARTLPPGLEPVSIGEDKARSLYAVSFSPGGTPLYEGAGPDTIDLHRADGSVAFLDRPLQDGTARALERTLYPLHSGQVFGAATRLLVLGLGLATALLALTGFLPWWKRRRARSARRRRHAAAPD